ncbi:hypothetical protein CsSME_00034951 [Camellia sinensis var. sinensis]
MVGDRPFLAGDSALDDLEVGVAISTAVLLPVDINRMVELSEYENYAMMMQHCFLGHSQAVKTDAFKKKFTQKTKEATKLLTSLNKAEDRIRGLLDKDKATKLALKVAENCAEAAENVAEVAQAEAKEAKEKEAQAQTEL